ncbi:hypothetical protein D3C73_1408420 [compost metagenome]
MHHHRQVIRRIVIITKLGRRDQCPLEVVIAHEIRFQCRNQRCVVITLLGKNNLFDCRQ